MSSLFELLDVSVFRQDRPLLSGVNWPFHAGEHWVLLGPNGSGKSTMLSLVALQNWPTTGRMTAFGEGVPGRPVAPLQKKIGLFETREAESLCYNYPGLTVLDVILFGLTGKLPYYSAPGPEQIDAAEKLILHHLSIPSDTRFAVLSSGERRRALLLKSIAARPDILLLDEPFESLDIAGQVALENLLRATAPQCSGTVTVIHRIQEVPSFATHAALLRGGLLWKKGPMEQVLTEEHLSATFGLELHLERKNDRYQWYPVS